MTIWVFSRVRALLLALMNLRKVGTSLKFLSMFSARISMALSTSKIVCPFALVVVAESRTPLKFERSLR
jgi:hypothetical protein